MNLISSTVRYKSFLCGLTSLIFLAGCQRANLSEETALDLSVEMAQEAFANELFSLCDDTDTDLLVLSSKAGADPFMSHEKTFGLDPGAYTPQWNKAKAVSKSDISLLYTPIIAQNLYAAIDVKNWEETHCTSAIKQVLLSERQSGSATISNFIVSAIPSVEYAILDTDSYRRQVAGLQKNFSGFLLYHTLDGELRRAERYEAGKLQGAINESNMPASIDAFAEYINQLLGEWAFYQISSPVHSRMMDDPEMGWSSENMSHGDVNNIMNSFYNNRNSYVNIGNYVFSGTTSNAQYVNVSMRAQNFVINRIEVVNTNYNSGSTIYYSEPNRVSGGQNVKYVYTNQNGANNMTMYLTPGEAAKFDKAMGY